MSPTRAFVVNIIGAFGWLILVSLVFVACGRTSSLECSHKTEQCKLNDWHWGISVRNNQFSTARYVDVIIQGRSVGTKRLEGRYFLLIGAYHGLSFASDDEFSDRDDLELQRQFVEAKEFIAKTRKQIYVGRRISSAHFGVLVLNLLLSWYTLRRIYRAVKDYRKYKKTMNASERNNASNKNDSPNPPKKPHLGVERPSS
jgi:hypothetical protein